MSNRSGRKSGGYFDVPNRWIDAGYMASCPGSVTQVYMHLSRWSDNESDEAAQPIALMAKKCGLTEKSTRWALRYLELWGVITRLDERNDKNHNMWLLNDLQKKCPTPPTKEQIKEERARKEQSSPPVKTTPVESSGGKKVTGQKDTPLYQPDIDQPNRSNQTEGITPTPKQSRKTRVPSDFRPDSPSIDIWAEKNGLAMAQIEKQVDPFIEHHTAKGTLYVDWQSAFKSWLRKGIEWGKIKTTTIPASAAEDDPWVMSPGGVMKRKSELPVVEPPPPPPADWGMS